MRTILLLLTALCLFGLWGVLNTAQADDNPLYAYPAKVRFCDASEYVAQQGREAALIGILKAEMVYSVSELAEEDRVLATKLLNWGYAFQDSSSAELKAAFLQSCLLTDPFDMPEVDDR